MFKAEDINRELQKEIRGLKRSTHKPIVSHARTTNVKPLTGMTSDRPEPARTRKSEPLPFNVKAVWHF